MSTDKDYSNIGYVALAHWAAEQVQDMLGWDNEMHESVREYMTVAITRDQPRRVEVRRSGVPILTAWQTSTGVNLYFRTTSESWAKEAAEQIQIIAQALTGKQYTAGWCDTWYPLKPLGVEEW